MQGLGFCVATLIVIEPRQVVEAFGHIRVLGPKRLLPNRERPQVERLGLGVLALGVIEPRQVVEASGYVLMLGPKRLLYIASARWYSGSASAYRPWAS